MESVWSFNARKALFSLFVFCLSASILFFAVPAKAHDGSAGTEVDPVVFDNFSVQNFDHNPDADPWKGWWTVTVRNDTDKAWGDFHFALFDIPGMDPSNVVFCDSSNALCQDPSSTQLPLTWNIYNGGKTIDLNYYDDPVFIGETATFQVYTDNTDNQKPFGISMYPTVLPEPVSSILFITGGGTLGLRRFWKKRRNI